MLSKHFSAHNALLSALQAMFSCQSAHIICNIEYREEKPGDFTRGRLAAELPTATTLQSSDLTHLHEQIWTTLNNLFSPFTSLLYWLKGTSHMSQTWYCYNLITCEGVRRIFFGLIIVSVGHQRERNYSEWDFIKYFYLLKEQCYSG